MNVTKAVTRKGAYGYNCTLSLLRSRRGRPYIQISGFMWFGNEGGRHTFRTPLTEAGYTKAETYLDMVEEGTVAMCDVVNLLGEEDKAGKEREIL